MGFGDLTGNAKSKLEKENAAERDAVAKQIALATAEAQAAKDEVEDLAPLVLPTEAKQEGDIEVLDVDATEKVVEFRINATLESVTIGYGNHYNFEQGKKYKAPKSVYDYLEERGLIWH